MRLRYSRGSGASVEMLQNYTDVGLLNFAEQCTRPHMANSRKSLRSVGVTVYLGEQASLPASAPYLWGRCDPWWAAPSFFGQTLAITGHVPLPQKPELPGRRVAPLWPWRARNATGEAKYLPIVF